MCGHGETAAATSTVMTARFRLCNQGRAREKRDPIEFSFHDLDFLCVGAFEFILLTG
jgi:hypothetical protein